MIPRKHIVYAFGGLIFCVGVLYVFADKTGRWDIYRDESNGYEIRYPASWHIKQRDAEKSISWHIVRFSNTYRTVNVVDLPFWFSPCGTEVVLEVAPQKEPKSIEQIQYHGHDSEVVDLLEMRQVGKFQGRVNVVEGPWYTAIKLVHKDTLYRLTCQSESRKQQNKDRAICRQILASFKII